MIPDTFCYEIAAKISIKRKRETECPIANPNYSYFFASNSDKQNLQIEQSITGEWRQKEI